VHHTLELVNVIISNSEMRKLILDTKLQGVSKIEGTDSDYIKFLTLLETQEQFKSIPKLKLKIMR
jgi:hypothetical protein